MIPEAKLNEFQKLLQGLTPGEKIWLSGYLYGIAYDLNSINETSTTATSMMPKPTIVYATETGNAKKLATQLASLFKKQRIQAKISDASTYTYDKLTQEAFLIIIISTHGDGELPESIHKLYEELLAKNTPLDKLHYSIFALGDTSYPLFCQAGVILDELLQSRKAIAKIPLVKADTAYQDTFSIYGTQLLTLWQSQTVEKITTAIAATTTTKKNYVGKLQNRILLNDRGANKETYHLEIVTNDTVTYNPGDALGIYPVNSTEAITKIAQLFEIDLTKTKELSLKNITFLSTKVLKNLGDLINYDLTQEPAQLIHLLEKYPALIQQGLEKIEAQLSPIAPRLYSISSSPEAHDSEIHLTINKHYFTINNQPQIGLASDYFTTLALDTAFEFYIHPNPHFYLPDADKPIIMIGPGTGIAPFRSFLAHRDATGATGKNWLIFGEQHFVSDFYYQIEIQQWIETGVITVFDAAFSRDQKNKIYVQDRIKAKATLFNAWIQEGAVIYICGQKNPMAKDVEQAIIEIIAQEQQISIEDAEKQLNALEEAGQYRKDVY